jgi:hypothetical protein
VDSSQTHDFEVELFAAQVLKRKVSSVIWHRGNQILMLLMLLLCWEIFFPSPPPEFSVPVSLWGSQDNAGSCDIRFAKKGDDALEGLSSQAVSSWKSWVTSWPKMHQGCHVMRQAGCIFFSFKKFVPSLADSEWCGESFSRRKERSAKCLAHVG